MLCFSIVLWFRRLAKSASKNGSCGGSAENLEKHVHPTFQVDLVGSVHTSRNPSITSSTGCRGICFLDLGDTHHNTLCWQGNQPMKMQENIEQNNEMQKNRKPFEQTRKVQENCLKITMKTGIAGFRSLFYHVWLC